MKARHNLGGAAAQGALLRWPGDAWAFRQPGGYYRDQAFDRWNAYLMNKLGPAYRAAGFTQGPRVLITAWAAPQRMEVGVHAVLSQIADAMRNGTNVWRLNVSTPQIKLQPAGLATNGFCGRGCVIVSHSAGGPLSIAAMNMAAAGPSRPWRGPLLPLLPRFIKGHVASHPALGGSEMAFHVLAGTCAVANALLSAAGTGPWMPAGVGACVAAADLRQSILLDLTPPVMTAVWRPILSNPGGSVAGIVPTLVVAGAHPSFLGPLHWSRPILPGFDDGVLSVDSQLGRIWTVPTSPRSLTLGSWGLLGARYFDRGSPTAKSIAYFIDQNRELARRPSGHSAAPNPYLLPNGMRLASVGLNEIPAASSGIPNVFSFLQSTGSHFFPRYVGTGSPHSQPNASADNCPAGTYSYLPSGTWFGAQAGVNEESRAVFDPSVYTNRGRNVFAATESTTGTIPLLSTGLMSAVEGEAKGRYVKLRFKLLKIDKVFWLWKREYIRMRDWRCLDEVDYSLAYAFRK